MFSRQSQMIADAWNKWFESERKEECKEEKSKMAKRRVKFTTTDGKKPTKKETPGMPFSLKMPMTMTIGPYVDRRLKLGVKCSMPCVVTRGEAAELFAPGTDLAVDIVAPADGLTLGEGEPVASAWVLDNTDLVLEIE